MKREIMPESHTFHTLRVTDLGGTSTIAFTETSCLQTEKNLRGQGKQTKQQKRGYIYQENFKMIEHAQKERNARNKRMDSSVKIFLRKKKKKMWQTEPQCLTKREW